MSRSDNYKSILAVLFVTVTIIGLIDCENSEYSVKNLETATTDSTQLYVGTYIGGSSSSGVEIMYDITLDSSNNVCICGLSDDSSYPTTVGSYDTSHNGGYDVVVSKFDPDCSNLLFSTFIGGSLSDGANCITTDENGDIYVAGSTRGSGFPVTDASVPIGQYDCFVCKLSSDGKSLLYSTIFGGSSDDEVKDIFVESGKIYVTGSTSSNNFPTVGAYDPSYNFNGDGFVAKIDPTSGIVYSSYIGGVYSDTPRSCTVLNGYLYITGDTASSDYPVTLDAYDTTFGGVIDSFVTKFSTNGASIVYSTYVGTAANDQTEAMDIDGAGHVYVCGKTIGTGEFPIVGGYNATNEGQYAGTMGFVYKLNPDGTELTYSTLFGGKGNDNLKDIKVDEKHSFTVLGYSSDTDNLPLVNPYSDTTEGTYNSFVTRFSTDGVALVYSSYIHVGTPEALAINESNYIFVTGRLTTETIQTTDNAYDTTKNGGYDGYVFALYPSTEFTIIPAHDVSVQQGSVNAFNIQWRVDISVSPNIDYTITENDTPLGDFTWTRGEYGLTTPTIKVSSKPAGKYIYEVDAEDSFGNTFTDTVFLTIIPRIELPAEIIVIFATLGITGTIAGYYAYKKFVQKNPRTVTRDTNRNTQNNGSETKKMARVLKFNFED